jgi:hypothetical protein
MDFSTIALIAGATIVGFFYMQRRRSRLSRDEE